MSPIRTPLPESPVRILLENGYEILAMRYVLSLFTNHVIKRWSQRNARAVDEIQIVLLEIHLEEILADENQEA